MTDAEMFDAALRKSTTIVHEGELAMTDAERPLPPSLAVIPNIPLEAQTLEQLQAERDYWTARVADAPGFASAKAADNFRLACEAWIERRSP